MDKVLYNSTRGKEKNIEASLAIIKGISSDGGLFVPNKIPSMKTSLDKLSKMNYHELAYEVMKLYFCDFTQEELKSCISSAYDEKFDTEKIAPVVKKGDAYFLELFHGATIAFKDMALSILPYLMKISAKKQNIENDIVILTATSGDTGKAALSGFANVEGTKIIVFYPKDGVSPIQKHQMVTQKGNNTYVIGIEGNFDDAQNAVKEIFNDKDFNSKINDKGYQFSSANSINIGRLVPQIVYYYYAYTTLVNNGELELGEEINFVVPTGNFGNILAAYYAKEMGLPISKLICASNENKVLYDFINTGNYNKKRDFVLTSSPSMDILISSNLERLVYRLTKDNPVFTSELMDDLASKGEYDISKDMKKELKAFYGDYASDRETAKAIKDVFDELSYLIDTHTAVGYSVYKKYKNETNDQNKTVIVATASPFKFTRSVMLALDEKYEAYSDFELIEKMKEISGLKIPNAIDEVLESDVLHKTICTKDKMREEILKILNY